jgi:DNA helicase-2/ATP-dependent DNA helicase PcrA
MRIAPYRIMAVTFTNKAAREMKTRLTDLIGEAGLRDLTIGTFHATCASILRRDGAAIGLDPHFLIYDTADQETVAKRALQDLNLDDKQYRPGAMLAAISDAKNAMQAPSDLRPKNYRQEIVQRVYTRYEELLAENNALDFDDLLIKVVRLWREAPDVLDKYRRRYHCVLVDEFQDTNLVQYELVRLLAQEARHVFVVGDEDQSIYSWRGADFRNVRRFLEDFPEAQTILLEQNYRSTQTILDAAASVIRHNVQRTDKNLWTENVQGQPITLYEAYDEREEAQFVADEIGRLAARGQCRYRECAVMYRTNAQSRVLEEEFLHRSLPYRVVGAMRFYGRREVKDALAYLRLVYNPDDAASLDRVLNVPARGIGCSSRRGARRWLRRLARASAGASTQSGQPSSAATSAASWGRSSAWGRRRAWCASGSGAIHPKRGNT